MLELLLIASCVPPHKLETVMQQNHHHDNRCKIEAGSSLLRLFGPMTAWNSSEPRRNAYRGGTLGSAMFCYGENAQCVQHALALSTGKG